MWIACEVCEVGARLYCSVNADGNGEDIRYPPVQSPGVMVLVRGTRVVEVAAHVAPNDVTCLPLPKCERPPSRPLGRQVLSRAESECVRTEPE